MFECVLILIGRDGWNAKLHQSAKYRHVLCTLGGER